MFPVIFTWAATVFHKTFTNSVLYFLSIALSDTAVPVETKMLNLDGLLNKNSVTG